MCLVNDNGKILILMLRADIIQNELELMHDGNDNFLAFVQQLFQVSRAFRPTDSRRNLHKLLNGVFNLFVEIDTVGNNDNGIKNLFVFRIFQRYKLMCKPSDRVGLAATGRVLN